MFKGLRSKKAPECGDLVAHGGGCVAVEVVSDDVDLPYVDEEMERKYARLQYRTFMLNR